MDDLFYRTVLAISITIVTVIFACALVGALAFLLLALVLSLIGG